jgi:antitoxin component of MazEF toxin-antitoxin module
MGLKDKRKIIRVGNSEAVTLPSNLVKGGEASIAANRLVIMDPRGEISEDDLLEFLEIHIEPVFWKWLRKRRVKNETAAGVSDKR